MTYGIWKIIFSFVFAVIISVFVYLNIRGMVPAAEIISLFLLVLIYAAFTRLFRL